MDPLTRAAAATKKALLGWLAPSRGSDGKKRYPSCVRLRVLGASPKEVGSMLRWTESAPENRHAFVLLSDPFESPQVFLRQAEAVVRRDEAALREGLRAARMLCFLSGFPEEEAVVSIALGTALFGQGEETRAIAAYERGRQLARRSGPATAIAQAAFGIGAVHYAKGRWAAARQAYAEPEADSRETVLLRIEALRMRAECWAAEARVADSLAGFDDAIAAVEREAPAVQALVACEAIGEGFARMALAAGKPGDADDARARVEAILARRPSPGKEAFA